MMGTLRLPKKVFHLQIVIFNTCLMRNKKEDVLFHRSIDLPYVLTSQSFLPLPGRRAGTQWHCVSDHTWKCLLWWISHKDSCCMDWAELFRSLSLRSNESSLYPDISGHGTASGHETSGHGTWNGKNLSGLVCCRDVSPELRENRYLKVLHIPKQCSEETHKYGFSFTMVVWQIIVRYLATSSGKIFYKVVETRYRLPWVINTSTKSYLSFGTVILYINKWRNCFDSFT